MNIGNFSIRNKYLILTFLIGIVILGIFAKATLNTQLSPDTNPPMATVITQYPGASAQDVVTDIVEPMEDEFGKLEGVKNVKGTSQDNIAIIQLEFEYSRNVDEAAIDIQNAISRIRQKLPQQMMEPRVLKFSAADKPIMTISLNSASLSMQDIRQLAEDKIVYDLQLLDGVASVEIFGGYNNEIQVKVDKNKLIGHGLSLEQISQVLSSSNIKAPGGKVTHNTKDTLIRLEEGFQKIDDLKQVMVPLSGGDFIYLEDIADIELSTAKLESAYRFNGEEAIALMITKKTNDNTGDVVNNVQKELKQLEIKYPFIDFKIAQDDSVFTTQMVSNMSSSVLIAILLTVIIIILFITKISQSLVVSISMPLVFLSTLGLMKLFDMKLDLVTLSALILSIGFVVDGAIVVVENIVRHRDVLGKDIVSAAIDATNEIALPSIAGATTTLIVLIPLLFIEGFVGEMFRPLSMTLIFAISSSIIVALLIIPLLTVLFGRFELIKTEKIISKVTEPFAMFMEKLLLLYIGLSKKALKNKFKTYLALLVLMGLSGLFLATNGVEMLPQFDSGTTFISIEMESGTNVEDTTNTIEYIEKFLDNEDNVIGYGSQIGYEKGSNQLGDFGIMGTNQGLITVDLNNRTERKETIWQFQERLRKEISKTPDIKRFVVKEKGGTAVASSTAPIDIKISGHDQEVLYEMALGLEEKIKEVAGTTNIYKSFDMENLQLNVKINHNRAQELGLNSRTISGQIYSSIEGLKSSTMDLGETKNLDILVEYMDHYRETTDDLLDVDIQSPLGLKVPLREVASIEVTNRFNIVTTENSEHTINILGYTHSRPFSHIVNDINKILADYPLPAGYSAALTGEQEALSDSMGDMISLLLMAIVFVYLILVPQFKSFIHPITIMTAIPLVIIGIAPALGLTGKYMSMPVLLGIILLAGTVVNNSILLIGFIQTEREEGMDVEGAIAAAITARFRPIMMTALSDVAGMLPLALQLALGSERFSPLAIAVIGGMLAATFLTIIIIPLTYATLEGTIGKLKGNNLEKSNELHF